MKLKQVKALLKDAEEYNRIVAIKNSHLNERIHDFKQQVDSVYRERDRLVAALSKVFPSHLAVHTDPDWDDEWRNIVCVHLPTGQAAWHVHESELLLFAHLRSAHIVEDHWDGHSTEEKYKRLDALERKYHLRASKPPPQQIRTYKGES